MDEAILRRNVLARRNQPGGLSSDDNPETFLNASTWVSEEETAYGAYPDDLAFAQRDSRIPVIIGNDGLDESLEAWEAIYELDQKVWTGKLHRRRPYDGLQYFDDLSEQDIRDTLANHKLRVKSLAKMMRSVTLFGNGRYATLVVEVDPLDSKTTHYTRGQLREAAQGVHDCICALLRDRDAQFLVEVESPDRLTSPVHKCIGKEWATRIDQQPLDKVADAQDCSVCVVYRLQMDQPGSETRPNDLDELVVQRFRPTVLISFRDSELGN